MNRIKVLSDITAKNPNDPFAHYALAIEYRNEDQFAEALKTFQSVRERFPDYLPNYYHLGAELERAEQLSEALTIYEQGIALAQAKGDAHAESELAGAWELLKDQID